MQFGSGGAQIGVIGRTRFDTGLGAIAYGTAELLARHFPVAFRPIEPDAPTSGCVTLPNGRRLPVWQPGQNMAATFYCDVPWNGAGDRHAELIPEAGLRYAWLLFDSDALPPRWVALLNERVDIVLVPSPHLAALAQAAGIERPIQRLPIPLDLDPILARPILARPPAPRDPVFTVGCIAAYHPRKAIETLIEAFCLAFPDGAARLVIHGNLAFGPERRRLETLAAGIPGIELSHGALCAADKDAMVASFDVFATCSRGEGYSIGPREALAAGKPVVASAVGAHRDLAGIPGVFLVEPAWRLPARYPEIDNTVFGTQVAVAPEAVADALRQARRFVEHDETRDAKTGGDRRRAAAAWSFSALASSVGALVDPAIARYRPALHPPAPAAEAIIHARLGRRADAIAGTRRQVCAAHDGGFFSVFNTYLSHLAWQERDDRCHAVLPDWDIDRFLAREPTPRSFCYGQPGDGNLWSRLFDPLFGATDADMQDPAYLWRHAELPANRHNQDREPLMTYVRAYKLYQSPDFAAWRRQYHRVFARHVRLRAALAAEIDAFAAAHLDKPVRIAAHVRHPSHTVEQPDGRIAGTDAYIARVRDELRRRGVDPTDNSWVVFVATDQDRVLHRFRDVFGDRAVFYPEARRTRAAEDAAFDALGPGAQNREGHQLQHLVAADPASWTWRMAWEVVRDAYTMARCQCLLHVVSNVSTAVAYMNPDLDMIFCSP